MVNVLIIDDDKDICLVLSKFLGKHDYSVDVAHTGDVGLSKLRSSEYALVLCDYRLPDMSGVEILQKIKVLSRTTPVIMITAYSDVRTAVETIKFGASDYITKPLYPDELLVTIRETIAKEELKKTGELTDVGVNKSEKKSASPGSLLSDFITGQSAQALAVQRSIELIAPSDMSVIIYGETGTGKEFVAQSIHKLSKRAAKPFIAIDCGALPKELARSELFGHKKGSFTGAIDDKPGSFELADSGTIFLDEIGNLSYENQINLLRVIQERKIKRIGATKDSDIDVRIIAATNEDLARSVKEGSFREDLYHRLNEFKIELSPLRKRTDDIMIFANHFLRRANHSLGKNVELFSSQVIDLLSGYYWHGNLRELNNVVKRAVLLASGNTIEPGNLPQEIVLGEALVESTSSVGSNGKGLLKSIAGSAERQAIVELLEQNRNNKSKVAELLNIDRKTLYNKLRLYNIKT